jgi:hypothetical protein
MNCFKKLIIFAKQTDEMLYQFLKKHFKGEVLLTENLEELPDLSDIPSNNPQSAIIFDDVVCMNTKTQNKIGEYAIACRKKNFSFFYLSQNYRSVKKLISRNCNYVILLKLNDMLDIKNILRDYSFGGINPKTLVEMYNEVQEHNRKHPDDRWFLWIDCENSQFCAGFTKVFERKMEPTTIMYSDDSSVSSDE